LRLSRDAALRAAQAAVRDATRLTRLLTILNDAGSLESLLERALATLSELFAAEVVILLDPAGTGSFTPLASLGLPEDFAELPFDGTAEANVPRTMREGGPLLVGDALTDPSIEPQLRELDVRSVLYLPVTASHAPRGVLILARCHATPFVFADVGLLTAMAYRIGLTVEQAQRRAQLERIVHSERAIGPDVEEAGVARRAVATFPDLVGADAATLVRLDDHDEVVFRADAGGPRLDDRPLEALVRHLLRRPDIRDLAAFDTVEPLAAGDAATPVPAGALLALPFGRARPEGLLLAFRSAPTPFDPDVVPIAVVYAGQTGTALENARLYRAVSSELADRRRAERALTASEARLGALIRSVHDLIVVIGADGDVRFANPAAARVWHAAEGGDAASEFWRRIRADERERLIALVAGLSAAPGETRLSAVGLLHDTADWHDYDVTLTNLLHDPAVAGIVATFHDVTERRIHERQLENLAFRDPLTGLANRTHFQERLRRALARREGGAVAVIFFDLDDFKVVNDSLGHEAGDVILKTVADRMRVVLRREDLGARLGGDEFTVLVEHEATIETAHRIATRLLGAIRAPVRIDERDVVVGGSFGIALGEAGTETADELLRKADVAMYHAKASGRNTCTVFSPGLATAAVRRLEAETNLRSALARGELEVFFQPLVSLADRRPFAAEALVRWRHPQRGLVLPGEFIPVAETTGLVVELGRVVIEEAFRRSQVWRRTSGVEVPISLNLSPRQLFDDGLVERVAGWTRAYGVDPTGITFEITENALIRNTEAAADVLRRLRDFGFRIAIDDFATGYSSLAYLKKFPVDVLKVDRSFVTDIARDSRDRAIVRSVLSLAGAFGLSVVAEGVEWEDQATTLIELGCTAAQGFLFAPPLPAGQFAALLPLFAGATPPGAADAAVAARSPPG
jgi:diguanylate cyclase (GGDEF)-like protein